MIKAVLFDNGGVLTEAGKAGGFRRRLAELYGVVNAADMEFDGLDDKVFRGTISTGDFFAELNRRYHSSPPVTESMFIAHAAPVFVRSDPVRTLVLALRSAGLRTGILSNVIAATAEEHQRRGDYDEFDPTLLSCYEGLNKPELAFYQRALARLELPANQVLFIDDREEFLLPARQLGMYTILATSPEQIIADVSGLLKAENNLELALQ